MQVQFQGERARTTKMAGKCYRQTWNAEGKKGAEGEAQ